MSAPPTAEAPYNQARVVELTSSTTKLFADLRLTRFSGREAINTLFEYELHLIARGEDSDQVLGPEGRLGETLTVKISGTQGPIRCFNGLVTEFEYLGYGASRAGVGAFHHYRAVLRPVFWLLTQRSNCEIFKKLSTPDIVGHVLSGVPAAHQTKLKNQYEPWEYRVQYRETDFDFVSRLLQHEGISYYFEHHDTKHDLVLFDDPQMLKSTKGYESVPFYPGSSKNQRTRDHIAHWTVRDSLSATQATGIDFNFETPTSLAGHSSEVSPEQTRPSSGELELFDYPAGPAKLTSSDVAQLMNARAAAIGAARNRARGEGDATGLIAGHLFQLSGHPHHKHNKKYLVLATGWEITSDFEDTWGRGKPEPQPVFRMSVEAVDCLRPWAPERITPKPVIQSAQTALVVGPPGKEIWTDKFGRVKLQFAWDRGKHDPKDDTTCWVRVAQGWAGKSWGTQYLPRVGQEVVVSFLDGDPDRPLVIGSVYNADQMPPYSLPDNATQSGVKTRSSPQGTADDYNELRFEDKKGSEAVNLQAQKDLSMLVKNDWHTEVRHDLKAEVKNDLTVTVTGKETRTITKERSTTAKDNDTLTVSKQFKLTANDSITLQCGAAKIVLKSDGSVEISGNSLKLSGTQKVAVDGAQASVSGTQVSVSGTKTAVAGSGTLDLSSSGIASLKGSLTKIG